MLLEVKFSKIFLLGSNGFFLDCWSKKLIDSWEDCEFDWFGCCLKVGLGCDGEGSFDGVCEGLVVFFFLW